MIKACGNASRLTRQVGAPSPSPPKPSPPPPPPPPPVPMEEVLPRLPPVLMEELVEEFLLRLPPDEPAWLVRSSAVCKPWRRILAAPCFRRRYRELHGTPPLLGYFKYDTSFVSTSALPHAQPHNPAWITLDCRHGRALFAPAPSNSKCNGCDEHFDFIVLEPVTGHQSRVPFPVPAMLLCSASVLCAAQGCDHHGCQGGHFLVAVVSTDCFSRVTYGWLYSSETRVWSQFTTLHHPDVKCASHTAMQSVLVGDATYFSIHAIIKCQLGTLSFSMLEKPIDDRGRLMTAEDGGLGFAAVVDAGNLTLWSMETGPEGAMGWTISRVIDLERVLPDGALMIPPLEYEVSMSEGAWVNGFAEGTQVIFVGTYAGCYMVDLKSGRVRTVSCYGDIILPYMRFYFPAMAAASTDQEQ